MAYDYDVHSPSSGPAAWLPQALMINGSPNNWRLRQARIDPNFRPNQVLRWDKSEASLAERILRREYARLGLVPDETTVRGLIATMAVEQCGGFNARLPDEPWNWSAFACFCQWFAQLTADLQMELLVDLAGNSCERWMPPVIQVLSSQACQVQAADPWLRGHNVWKIPDAPPYVFDAPPPGTTVVVPAPPGTLPTTPNPVTLPDVPVPPGPPFPQAIPGSLIQGTCDKYPGGFSCQWIDFCRATSGMGSGCAWYCDLDATALGCPSRTASSSAPLVTSAAAVEPASPEKPKASTGAWVAGTLIALTGIGLFAAALSQPARNPEGEHPGFGLLAEALAVHKLPTSTGERRARADEFMLMQSDRNTYWFKHRESRNYLGVQRWTGALIIPKTDEPFNKGVFDVHHANPVSGIEQNRVRDPFMASKSLSRWYASAFKKIGKGTRVALVQSEYGMPRGWDYSNHSALQVTLPSGQTHTVQVALNVAEAERETSGNIRVDGQIVGIRRGKTPEHVASALVSEAIGHLRA
jgi:hypothetical protein